MRERSVGPIYYSYVLLSPPRPIDFTLPTPQNKAVPQAIFFDLDNTIITWATPPEPVWELLAHRYAAEADGVDPPVLLEAINKTREWYWGDLERHRTGRLKLNEARREIVRMALNNLHIDNPALADKISNDFTNMREQDEYIATEAFTTLENLRERGLRLALITNGGAQIQRAKIEKFKLAPFFDNIIIEGEFGCGKPDERVFRHTLEKLKVRPSAAWMVGDDLRYDIEPCRALGIYSLWVNGKVEDAHKMDGVRPDKVIRSITELPGLL